jgi:D-alanine--poly(phosphoribitol) ligase subunit 2
MDDLLRLLRQVLDRNDWIDADTPLISSGLFDSFAVVGLLVEIESQYGVVIEPEEVDAASFDTPRQILERIGKS